jgi:hypothetical protein
MLQWLVATSVLFGLWVVIAALSGAPIPDEVVQYANKIPDWMQGVGTAAAAYLAWLAYKHWRRPDDTRLRAETARLILRKSQELETAALAARVGSLHVSFDNTPFSTEDLIGAAAAILSEDKTRERETLQSELNAFRTFRAEARFLFAGTPTADRMEEIERQCQEILTAFDRLSWLDEAHRQLAGEQRFRKALDETLGALGERFAWDYELDETDEDPFRTRLVQRFDTLRTGLAPFLIGS